jgi:hypothetical protein
MCRAVGEAALIAGVDWLPARSRVGLLSGLLCGLCLGWLALPEAALALGASEQLEIATGHAKGFEYSMMRWRLAIALCALALVAFPLMLRRFRASEEEATNRAKRSKFEVARVSLLLFLALASFASYYNFFRENVGAGFKQSDVYHYYMGSKYFSEVGYFDLYHCTVWALVDSGHLSRFDLPRVRDQRTMRIHTPKAALAAAKQCRKQFSDHRWQQFESDATWFSEKFQGNAWSVILFDHGYNPSPVWNAIGGAITSRVPLRSAAFDWLIYSDRVMMIGGFLLIAWAFGLEVAALSAIVWGTGQHWRWAWIGDSLLRNLWLFGVIAGLCFLRRNRNFLGGAFLSFASLLRVFPAIFVLGYALHSWIGMRRGEDWRPAAQSFAFGVLSAAVVLLAWSMLASEWGAAVYLEFWEKIAVFTDQRSLNKLGLTQLFWSTLMMSTGHFVISPEGKLIVTPYSMPWMPFAIRLAQFAVLIPTAFLFWKAISRLRSWEAAALGFALIPLLSEPANYYYSFVICGVMLAGERPRLMVYLMASAVLWLANGLWFYRLPQEYMGAVILAVVLSLAVLYEMSRGHLEAPSNRH